MKQFLLVAALALGMVAGAQADPFVFQFAGLGSSTPTGGVACEDPGDYCGTALDWTDGDLSVEATTQGASKYVIQDRNPENGGLGVLQKAGKKKEVEDQVDQGEVVFLTFSEPVSLQQALFHNGDHGALSALSGFLYEVDGGGWNPRLFTDVFSDTGTVFGFKYGGPCAKPFYVSSVGGDYGDSATVPEPGTLLLLGAGVLMLRKRMRRVSQA